MKTARRFGVYNLVGLGGFVLQVGIIALLTRLFEWHYAFATIVGLQAAIIHNYFGDTRWTWADRPVNSAQERVRRAVRYQTARSVGLAINVALTTAFVTHLGVPVEMANILAVGCCSVFNFAFADRVVFGQLT